MRTTRDQEIYNQEMSNDISKSLKIGVFTAVIAFAGALLLGVFKESVEDEDE